MLKFISVKTNSRANAFFFHLNLTTMVYLHHVGTLYRSSPSQLVDSQPLLSIASSAGSENSYNSENQVKTRTIAMLIKYLLLLETILLQVASGHLIMMSPEPYSNKSLNNSPLAYDGSDFPCKLREDAFLAPTKETVYEVGVVNTMRFRGSATHGGGSCQLSLTEDLLPSKQSMWKVIKSYEGGCPKNSGQNLAGGADTDDDIQLDFAIPEHIHPGRYTLAWTWFNRIGNREMYMNCAPITVENRSSHGFNQSTQNTPDFPPMCIANINGCMTQENLDIRFPQPGTTVELNGLAQNLLPEDEPVCTGTPTLGVLAAKKLSILDPEDVILESTVSLSLTASPTRTQSSTCSCRGLRRSLNTQ